MEIYASIIALSSHRCEACRIDWLWWKAWQIASFGAHCVFLLERLYAPCRLLIEDKPQRCGRGPFNPSQYWCSSVNGCPCNDVWTVAQPNLLALPCYMNFKPSDSTWLRYLHVIVSSVVYWVLLHGGMTICIVIPFPTCSIGLLHNSRNAC